MSSLHFSILNAQECDLMSFISARLVLSEGAELFSRGGVLFTFQ